MTTRAAPARQTPGRATIHDPAGHDPAGIVARLDRLPPTRTVWRLVALLGLGFFFELYDLLFTGYVAPGLVTSGILTPTTPGLFGATGVAGFVAALFTGLFIGTVACGWLADRFGRRAIFTWSLLFYTAATTVMAFQTDAFGLNLWRLIAGIGLGLEMVTIGSYLSELVPKAIRGRAFALCQGIGFCAVPVVAFLSYRLIPLTPFGLDGWRWVALIGASGALLVWWIRSGLPESPRWLVERGRIAEAEAVMARLEAQVQAEYGRPLPPPGAPQPAAPRGSFRDIWVPPYRRRTLMMAGFNLFQPIGFYGFANWVPTLLIAQGITVTSSLAYTALIALAAPVGPLIGLLIADRFERKHVIVAAALVYIACGLTFAQARDVTAIVILGIGLTLASNVISYSFHTYQAELFPTGIRARAVGFVYSWSRFSAIFTGFLIAFVLREAGTTGVFLFISAAMLVAGSLVGLLGPRTRDVPLEEIAG
ncbi:MFS transporter [Methylobacterium aerolatum]|uniref:MFS transporter n=1 Tax=Methylobacterium aerolatum TaxID=418708 RepID=A0ABU0HVT2_9HYPH|nr:MFS transporter [Methylobacterium aerolatum]MDQ0446447.1 putative MFS transporter [Methylobacterium aerolatum]GJD33390.1 Inner membrane metabolite transport protein YdjE [Methylobacterium aerolatum]